MKIAIISDLHLAPGKLNRCGVGIDWITQTLDLLDSTHDEVIVGGDLYDLSRPSKPGGWSAHRDLIQREFGEVIQRLESYPAVFGNHDRARGIMGVPQTLSRTGNIRVLVQHGHQFDGNLKRVPGLEGLANYVAGMGARLGLEGIGTALGAIPATLEKLSLRDGPDANTLGAQRLLETSNFDIVVTGHTHLLRAIQSDHGIVANSGAWSTEPQWISIDLNTGNLELVRDLGSSLLKTAIGSRLER